MAKRSQLQVNAGLHQLERLRQLFSWRIMTADFEIVSPKWVQMLVQGTRRLQADIITASAVAPRPAETLPRRRERLQNSW